MEPGSKSKTLLRRLSEAVALCRPPGRRFGVRWAGLVPILILLVAAIVWATSAPTTLEDFFLPGSQPGQSGQMETPDKCDNCHGGYDTAVEPSFNWRGSMMAQAARDPLFYAAMTIANQDAPDSGDLCIRCHTPGGWLGGRSIPTDGSALTANDREGVTCDFCHQLVTPTPLGINPYPGDPDYTSGTYPQDQSYLGLLSPIPGWSANGMYIVDSSTAKRGPFTNHVARHAVFYTPLHRESALCGTCHDVSNPAHSRQPDGTYAPNTFGQRADVDNGDFDPQKMFPVERTYSEWKMSAFASGGVDMGGRFGGNKTVVSTCQDCHLQDITGPGCNKPDAPIRTDLPWHDMTGGNTFIPLTLAALWPGEVNQAALDAGVLRARSMLQKAATLAVGSPLPASLRVRVTNETAHKLPSGYPEGRRIWINVRFFNRNETLIGESGAYDALTAALTHDREIKVYEIKPGLSEGLAAQLGLPAGPSFHFVLNSLIYSDNRIPPRGFTNANFEAVQSPPVGYTYADEQYWDDTYYALPNGTARAEVRLFYQTLSREYVEFLRDENRTNTWGTTLYSAWETNGKSTPELMVQAVWNNPRGISLAPISLAFGDRQVGTPTPSQAVTLANTGTDVLTVSSFAITGANAGDFSQTHTCGGGGVAPGGSCTVSVTFTPTATGPRNAVLTVTSDAPESPSTVSLSGTGTLSAVSLTPTSLAFEIQKLGTVSPAQSAILSNVGTEVVNISSIAIAGANSGDFVQTNNCGTSLAVSTSCTLNVSFAPTAGGPRRSLLVITDDAPGSPHQVILSGVGSALGVSPSALNFPDQQLGSTSPPSMVTLTNFGNSAINIWQSAITGANSSEFDLTNDCPIPPATLARGSSCSFGLTFSPAAPGPRVATLLVSHDGGGSPHSVPLTGAGIDTGGFVSPSGRPRGREGGGNAPTLPRKNTRTSPLPRRPGATW